MSFVSIQSVFSEVAAKYGLRSQFEAAEVCYVFNTLVVRECSEKLSHSVKAQYLKDKVLWVAAKSSASCNRLSMSTPKLLTLLQERFGTDSVRSIRIVQADIF
jgi:predicted nucleic acid-binding Zn ribbon protein